MLNPRHIAFLMMLAVPALLIPVVGPGVALSLKCWMVFSVMVVTACSKSPCAILGHIPTGELRDLLKLEKGIPKLEVRVCWTYLDPQGGNSHGTNFAKTVVE
jgi:hypothetical protein